MPVNERLSGEVTPDLVGSGDASRVEVVSSGRLGNQSSGEMAKAIDPVLPGQFEALSMAPKKKTTTPPPAGQISDADVMAILNQQAGREPTDPKGKPILTGDAWQTVLKNEERQRKKKKKVQKPESVQKKEKKKKKET